MVSLRAEAVSVRLGGRAILEGVSLGVDAGEILALLGPNGAGKTTLLSVLAGDTAPVSGAAMLDDLPLATWPARALARRRAVMMQTDHLVFPFPVREVVRFGRHPHPPRLEADVALIENVLAAVDAAHLAATPYTRLSGGERRRVQLARALVQVWGDDTVAPGFALLDEHTAHLDPAAGHASCRLLRECADRGMGLLVVMHDINLALAYADRVAFLRNGRLLFAGSPADARSPRLLEQVYGVPFRTVGGEFMTIDTRARRQVSRSAL